MGYADDLTFAIPFAGGLAFGETTNQAELLGTMIYEADDEGSGFTMKNGPTSTELPGGSRLGARISSYLSADQLNPRQDALLKAWQGLREKHDNIWQDLTDITVCNKNKSSNTLMLQSLGSDVGLLAKSDLWTSAIRPSRPAVAREADHRKNKAEHPKILG